MGPSKSAWMSFLGNVFKAVTQRPVAADPLQPETALGRARLFLARLARASTPAGRLATQIFRGVGQVIGLSKADFTDGVPKAVNSSWIKTLTFRPFVYRAEAATPDQYGAGFFPVPDKDPRGLRLKMNDIGDLIMLVLHPSRSNPSGSYTYPRVPRRIMADWTAAPSKGRYYWAGEIRQYSDRRAIFQRFARYGSGPTFSRPRR